MSQRTPVEIADVYSRKRPIIFGVATVLFLVIQVVTRPFFTVGPETANYLTRQVMWSINVIFLLLCLGTGGGILSRSDIRALVNDEVSRSNYRTSAIAGFWVAMVTAPGPFLPAGHADLHRPAGCVRHRNVEYVCCPARLFVPGAARPSR